VSTTNNNKPFINLYKPKDLIINKKIVITYYFENCIYKQVCFEKKTAFLVLDANNSFMELLTNNRKLLFMVMNSQQRLDETWEKLVEYKNT
jgi:hypothetical protein